MGGWKKTFIVSKAKGYKITMDWYRQTQFVYNDFHLKFFYKLGCYLSFNSDLISLYGYTFPIMNSLS